MENSFYLDLVGEDGSLHVSSLCKWGKAKSIFRERKKPSGYPKEITTEYQMTDPTWKEKEIILRPL